MGRKLISSGSVFEQQVAYSRAVLDGDYVFVAGTTGYEYGKMNISDDIAEQAEQCFKNIEAVLVEAGSAISEVVRVTYILPNRDDFEKCLPVTRKYFGKVRPAGTVFEARLLNDEMKIEIEVTARKLDT